MPWNYIYLICLFIHCLYRTHHWTFLWLFNNVKSTYAHAHVHDDWLFSPAMGGANLASSRWVGLHGQELLHGRRQTVPSLL